MLNTVIKFVVENRSLLTTITAIAGFALSLSQFVYSLWNKRTNISVSFFIVIKVVRNDFRISSVRFCNLLCSKNSDVLIFYYR